jgi:serine/threonine protein kinase/WD40 repeat protein
MFKTGDTPIPGYPLIRFIGQGAYGEVWEAQAPGGARAALKFISLQSSAGGVELKSANAVKLIRHANLIPITAIWVLSRSGDVLDDQALEMIEKGSPSNATLTAEDLERKENLAYLVIAMSLADECLETQFKRYRDDGLTGIPREMLLEYLRDAAKGLDFLNEPRHWVDGEQVGIVHRDIKPANLLLLGDSVVVGDFGVATSLRDFDVQATRMVGSLAYMAPESLSKRPTKSTDQYALAISYYYLRTGRMPFEDGHTFDSLALVHKEGRLDFSLVPEPERLVLKRATAVPPTPRYPNCSSFVSALSNVGHPGPVEPSSASARMGVVVLSLIAIGAIGFFSWWKFQGDPSVNVSRSESKSSEFQRQLKFFPAETNYEIEWVGRQSATSNEPIRSSGEEANFQLVPGDTLRILARVDSPLYDTLDQVYTCEQLEAMDWQIELPRQSVNAIRAQAFGWAGLDRWNEARELLALAAIDRPEILELPTPVVTPLERSVTELSVAENSFAVVALNENKQTSFRFSPLRAATMTGSEIEPLSSKTPVAETLTENWIDTELTGVRDLFPTSEPSQWLIVMADSIGCLSQDGEFQALWHDADNVGISFSKSAISPDGRVLACSDYSGNLHLWNIAMDGSVNDYERFAAHDEMVLSLNFVDDENTLLSTAADGTIARLAEIKDGTGHALTFIETPTGKPDEFVAATVTFGQRLIVGTERHLRDIKFGANRLTAIGPDAFEGLISLVRSCPRSSWVMVGTDSISKPVQLLNLDTKIVVSDTPNLGTPSAATFSQNGKWIAVASYEGKMLLINLEENAPTWCSLPTSGKGYSRFLKFANDDNYLITILDTGIEEIWPIDQLRLILQTRAEISILEKAK